jgi:multidrug efflux pump subunit AcrB
MPSRGRTTLLIGMIATMAALTGLQTYLHEPAADTAKTTPALVETMLEWPDRSPLLILVETTYPGASAETVADAVAVPIEQQVNGVEHMLSMSSWSGRDGKYSLLLAFEPGADPDRARTVVQDRVSLAMPLLPKAIHDQGISVLKTSPQPFMLATLTSPAGLFDETYLGHYASLQFVDELVRVPGVAGLTLFGERYCLMRITLDGGKLAAHGSKPAEVVAALSQQNIKVVENPGGEPPQFTIHSLARITEVERVGEIVLKASAQARVPVLRLKDVAKIELGSCSEGDIVRLDGKSAVVLSIHFIPNASPRDVSRAVLMKLHDLQRRLPDGLALEAPFDFALQPRESIDPNTPEYLVIDVDLPGSSTIEYTGVVLERAAELVRATPGVHEVLSSTRHPFSMVKNRPCLVVRLGARPERNQGEQLAAELRRSLREKIPEAGFRLTPIRRGYPVYGYPIDFAIADVGNIGAAVHQARTDALAARMKESGKFLDVGVDPGLRAASRASLVIDRAKCSALGVAAQDIVETLQALRSDRIRIAGQVFQVDPRSRPSVPDLRLLFVKNKQGQMFPLDMVAAIHIETGSLVIERFDLYRVERITANLGAGVSLDEARSLVEKLVRQELDPGQFRVTARPR